MLNFIKRQLGLAQKKRNTSPWYPLSQTPEGFWRPNTGDYRHATPHEANTLSTVYNARDRYKRAFALCPLIVYRKGADGGRDRATSHPAYTLLHDAPNPAMSATTLWERFVDDYFLHGEFVAILRWKNNNNLMGIYPVPHSALVDVKLDDEWNKTFFIRNDANEVEPYDAADIIHVLKDSKDGIRGRSIFDFAAENLGMHRTIAEAANAFFKNAVQPSIYVNQLAPSALDVRMKEQKAFEESYAGSRNAGKVPFVANAEINSFPGLTAEEAGLLEALNRSKPDVENWFGLPSSDLKYATVGADKTSFFSTSFAPVQVKLQNELNIKLFGAGADTYCEFLTRAVLQGDAAQEQTILNGYIMSGVMTRAEAREILNMPALPGLDTPLAPVNQAVVTGAADAQPLEEESVNVNTSAENTL